MSDQIQINELVCSDCRRLFDVNTGRIKPGWETARFISTSAVLCDACKTQIIERLAQGVPTI